MALSFLYPVAAFMLYLGAHGLRCVRLYVLSLGARRGGARLIAVHCLTAWPNAIIPFKLGELLRIAGFGIAVKSPLNGLAIWLVERLSDAVALGILTLGLSFMLPLGEAGTIALVASAGFIAVCLLTAWVAVELAPFLRNDLLYRSRSQRGFLLLRLVSDAQRAASETKRLLVGRFSVTLLIAFLIWACEFGAMAFWAWAAGGALGDNFHLIVTDTQGLAERMPVIMTIAGIGVVFTAAIVVRRLGHAA